MKIWDKPQSTLNPKPESSAFAHYCLTLGLKPRPPHKAAPAAQDPIFLGFLSGLFIEVFEKGARSIRALLKRIGFCDFGAHHTKVITRNPQKSIGNC